ncbi:MAG TPA: hypothetical protein ENG29_02315 [Firmicutes bacterium]|nr:MAG: hypothetical protein DRH49_03610 [Candidatus Coatesbacteria bacterium]RLC43359.1 MAG: hypothetical protein DRH44_05030 [Candidatus Coatesbacteria bacterium]HDM43207.1 hypothetical protein [Bacillota bacterium]
MRYFVIISLLLFIVFSLFAQERYVPYGEERVIDSPTAWTKGRGEYEIYIRFLPFIIGGELGLSDFLTLGISYGGSNVIGYGSPDWNPRPAFLVKAQLTQGGAVFPAIAIGYDDQGWGPYHDEINPYKRKKDNVEEHYNRYQYKSKGIFCVFTQEFSFLGVASVHFGVNYAITERSDDRSINVYAALEKSITPDFYVLCDYDPGWNDNNDYALGGNKGYLDLGIRWRISKEFNIEAYAMNLLQNQKEKLGEEGRWYRALFLSYETYF